MTCHVEGIESDSQCDMTVTRFPWCVESDSQCDMSRRVCDSQCDMSRRVCHVGWIGAACHVECTESDSQCDMTKESCTE